nr:MAG TPA_asm: hypothetical protein [Caudoviricetes sp.]
MGQIKAGTGYLLLRIKPPSNPHQAAFWRSFHIYSVLTGNNDPNMVDLFSAIAQNHRNHNQNLR